MTKVTEKIQKSLHRGKPKFNTFLKCVWPFWDVMHCWTVAENYPETCVDIFIYYPHIFTTVDRTLCVPFLVIFLRQYVSSFTQKLKPIHVCLQRYWSIEAQCSILIETVSLTFNANQLTRFYMSGTIVSMAVRSVSRLFQSLESSYRQTELQEIPTHWLWSYSSRWRFAS